jgi:MurNAc alpha-1-phosphate uridylyltransferase
MATPEINRLSRMEKTKTLSDTAMILAAGRGERMRPLSLKVPKPLLEIGGRAMLDLALDKLIAFGIARAVVNAFYLAGQIEAHLEKRRDIAITVSREDELLDTGGGIKYALSNFDVPFFALNADLPWMDGTAPALLRMAEFWDAAKMDALLLLMPTKKAPGFRTKGDFALEKDGRAHRHDASPPYPYVWISAQIVKPEFYSAVPEKIFSNNKIWDAAEARGKLYGIIHDGSCYHVGTPEDLAEANRLLASGQGWLVRRSPGEDKGEGGRVV